MATRSRGRNWCFTLNNHTVREITTLTQAFSEKNGTYVFQEEKGAEGTKHLQGIVMFKNAISFNSIKKLMPRAHIEATKNKMASINYCTKEETRDGGIYSNFDYMNVTRKRKNAEMTTEEKNRWIVENMPRLVHELIQDTKRDGTQFYPPHPWDEE